MRVEGVVLEDHGHVAVAGRQIVDEFAVESDRPRSHVLEAGDHPQHGRLAAARRADEDHELALLDGKVERAARPRRRSQRPSSLARATGSPCASSVLLRRRDPDPHRSSGPVGPREVWNGEQLRRRRRSRSRQLAEVAVFGVPPPVEVADDARQAPHRAGRRAAGPARCRRDRLRDRRRRRPGRGQARDRAARGSTRRARARPRGSPAPRRCAGWARSVEARRRVGARPGCHPASGVSPRRNHPRRRLRRRGSPLAPSPGCGARASTRDRGS